jgi:hypothetical protein
MPSSPHRRATRPCSASSFAASTGASVRVMSTRYPAVCPSGKQRICTPLVPASSTKRMIVSALRSSESV